MNTLTKNILKGVAAGLLASWIKALVEPPLQEYGEKKFPPKRSQLEIKGADVTGHPENMPPAVLAKEVYYASTGSELPYHDTLSAMKFIHYALGAVIGVVYVTVVNEKPKLRIEQGITAGITVWACTHGSLVPALGLQGKVREMPKSWWVWEFGSHIIFGVAIEQSRKLLNRLF